MGIPYKEIPALRLQVKYYTDVRLDASLSGAGLSSIAYVTKRALRAANSRRIFGKSKDEKPKAFVCQTKVSYQDCQP